MTMKLGFILRATCAALLAATCVAALGQTGAYPNRTVIIQSPGAVGGFTDTVARLVAAGLAERWKSPVVVENRVGAGGTIGATYAATQPPDGYYLLLSNVASDVISPAIYKGLKYDSLKDFEPVSLVVKTPVVVAVNNDLPVKTLAELVALAKAKPGELNFGYPGNGSTGHFAGSLFNLAYGVKLTPVPYKGTPEIMTSLLANSIQVTFDNAGLWAPHVTGGRVRALAVTSLKRNPLMPNVPTLVELGGNGFEAVTFAGISAPRGTPRDIVDKLNRDIQAVIHSNEFRTKMSGGEITATTPEEYRKFIADEQVKWGKVAREIGLAVN